MRILIFSAIFTLLVGCKLAPTTQVEISNTQTALTLSNYQLFETKAIPSETDIFTLPESEKIKFLGEYNSLIEKGVRPDRALYQYIEKSLVGFTYDGNTQIADVSLKEQKGNCISLAVLTQAYANIVGIETSYREVSTFPIYKKEQDLLMISSHFSTKLFAPKEIPQSSTDKSITSFQFGRSGSIVDYFPQQSTFYIGNAKYPSLVAKFYANLASVALVEGNLDLSFSLTTQALKFKPDDPELINLIAIIHRRAGDNDTTKKLFEFAVENNLTSSNLFASYQFFAKSINDAELVNKLAVELEKSAKTPFDFLQLARKEISNRNFNKAEKIINTVIEEHFYLSEPYFELAKLHYLTGRTNLVKLALEQAEEMADTEQMSRLYQAKLSSLELTDN